MYPNAASNFILGFVSPSSSAATPSVEDGGEGAAGGTKPAGDNDWAAGCEALMSATSGNGSLTHFFHSLFNDSSHGGGGWEMEWTGGGLHKEGDNAAVAAAAAAAAEAHANYNNYRDHYGHRLQGAGVSSSPLGGNYEWGNGKAYCPMDWDNILCWPRTIAGDLATMPCFDNLHGIPYNASGFAKRLCMEGGIWNRTEYAECKPYAPTSPAGTDTGNLDITTGIYLFGYCLSLFALVAAAIIFISLKELRCLRNTIHCNLMVTYVLADALWVLSVVSTDQGRNVRHTTQATCFTFILLHYFHLTNFFWMFVEGLYLYVLVVQTFMTESIRLRTYCLIGWGLPILIVLIWTVTKWATLSDETRRMIQMAEVEFNSVVCPWLHANQYDWIYISSALIVLGANMVFLLQIMWVLITKLRSATSQETQQSRKAAKALVVLMPLLGITYVLVLFAPKRVPIFEHIRAFLLSTQGFLVALLYCFLNNEVRTAVRHRWSRVECPASRYNCLSCVCPESSSQNTHRHRDWSPRSRTESIRLYTPNSQVFRKRGDSSVSETTMITAMGGSSLNGGSGTGNGSTAPVPIVASLQGKRVSTTVRLPATFAEEGSDLDLV